MPEPHVIQMGEIWDGWDGQWIKIKPWMSYAASQAVEAAGVDASMSAGGERKVTLGITSVDAAAAWVKHQVLEWHLLDHEGNEIDATPDGIAGETVPPDLIDQAIGAISDYYEAMRPPPFREDEDGG